VPAVSVAPSFLSSNLGSGNLFSSSSSLLLFFSSELHFTSQHQSAILFFHNIINIIFFSFLHFAPAGLGTLLY